ncbi:hypothetical protein Purlil1_12552 [Purpureocillium lilacinum]|uniref:DUF7587 domain-containing protein n=1 Tax=Purpureocillium lilacinum TaxID=33203 RepID=A0ABR0BHM8_PURLI|nr:hypothetical protein Purlil1_12552 [Purpureocillium lilacinum]
MDPLTEKLKDLDRCSACLRFNPTGDAAEKIRAKLSQTPRYLFRVYDKKTSSATDARWVRSLDAINAERNHASDIFMRSDTRAVAQELNEHLRWWHTTSGKNNIVSWTSSLPFAFAYGVYRNTSERLKSPVQEIHLCVVDTSKLPHGAFINDLDLMQEYSGEFGPDEHIPIWIRNQPSTGPWRQFGLPNLIEFRRTPDKDGRRHGQFSAYNYFGEYLSQGALKIESACTILSFNKILGPNLYTIYPGFGCKANRDQAKWATAVLELREAFYDGDIDTLDFSQLEDLGNTDYGLPEVEQFHQVAGQRIQRNMDPKIRTREFPADCLPPEGKFESRDALFAAINAWAAPRGYAFTTGRSTRKKANGRPTVTYTCDRAGRPGAHRGKGDKPMDPKRQTSTRITGCQFSINAKQDPDGTQWHVKHRPGTQFAVHNHEPSPHISAHPSLRALSASDEATISDLTQASIAPRDIRTYLRQNSSASERFAKDKARYKPSPTS